MRRTWRLRSGIDVVGDTWGPARADVVLLLHGGGQTRYAWKNTGQALASAGFYAVAVDARGHGDSSWARDGDYEQDSFVADLVELIEQLGTTNPHLVGASMGGATALVAVGERHVDARSLVLVDIGPVVEVGGAERIWQFVRNRPHGFDSLDEVAEAVAAYLPHRERPGQVRGLTKNVRKRADGRYYWHWDPRYYDREFDLATRELRLTEASKRVDVPTLLIRGGLSDLLSENGARRFLELCPHAQYVNVAGAGHMVAGERNDRFRRAVVDFLVTEGRSRP